MGGDTETPIQSSASENGIAATLPPLAADEKSPRNRKRKSAEPEATQEEPTARRAIDRATGLELDEYGLPISGPARRLWLAEAGIDDPALKPVETEAENSND